MPLMSNEARYRAMALAHWQTHLPVYYQQLKTAGTLEQEAQRVAVSADETISEIVAQHMADYPETDTLRRMQVSETARKMAEEMTLPQLILLPPEDQEPEMMMSISVEDEDVMEFPSSLPEESMEDELTMEA